MQNYHHYCMNLANSITYNKPSIMIKTQKSLNYFGFKNFKIAFQRFMVEQIWQDRLFREKAEAERSRKPEKNTVRQDMEIKRMYDWTTCDQLGRRSRQLLLSI
jgi:DNA-binding MurR/RpiR family transcriptional regulator